MRQLQNYSIIKPSNSDTNFAQDITYTIIDNKNNNSLCYLGYTHILFGV